MEWVVEETAEGDSGRLAHCCVGKTGSSGVRCFILTSMEIHSYMEIYSYTHIHAYSTYIHPIHTVHNNVCTHTYCT